MKVEVVLIVYLAIKCVSPVRHYLQNGQSALVYIVVLSHGYNYNEKTRAKANIQNIRLKFTIRIQVLNYLG